MLKHFDTGSRGSFGSGPISPFPETVHSHQEFFPHCQKGLFHEELQKVNSCNVLPFLFISDPII